MPLSYLISLHDGINRRSVIYIVNCSANVLGRLFRYREVVSLIMHLVIVYESSMLNLLLLDRHHLELHLRIWLRETRLIDLLPSQAWLLPLIQNLTDLFHFYFGLYTWLYLFLWFRFSLLNTISIGDLWITNWYRCLINLLWLLILLLFVQLFRCFFAYFFCWLFCVGCLVDFLRASFGFFSRLFLFWLLHDIWLS